MPDDFELKFLATGKRYTRTVDGQGRISWKRYRLYVRLELKKEKVETREFFDSLVVIYKIYKSGTLASYECTHECTHERSQITSVSNTPVFHDHPGVESAGQLELFDFSHFQLRYVSRRHPNQKHPQGNAIQLLIEDLV